MNLKSTPLTGLSQNSSFDFTGWKLEDVHAALTPKGADMAPIVVIETAPALRKGSNQTFGSWRVLRCHRTPEQQLELVVARELLTEERRSP